MSKTKQQNDVRARLLIILGALVVLAVVGTLLFGRQPAASSPKQEVSVLTQAKNQVSNQVASNVVVYYGDLFSPKTTTVKPDTTVTFNASGGKFHLVSDQQVFDSGGDVTTYQYTFKTAGTWTYHNADVPSQTGSVVVSQ